MKTPYENAMLRKKAVYFLRMIQQHGTIKKAATAAKVDRGTITRTIKRAQEMGAL